MYKGKTFRRLILARLSVMAAAFLICTPTQAQQGAPEVYVDMGVLQGLGTQPQQAPQPIKLKPPTPKPPAAQGMPSLIAPSVPPVSEQPAPQAVAPAPIPKPAPKPAPAVKAVAVEPPKPKPEPKTPYVSKAPDMPDNVPLKSVPPPPVAKVATPEPVKKITPVAVMPVVEEVVAETPAPPAEMAPAPEAPQMATFPLEHKVREETSNPATSSTSRPVPLRPGVAGNLNDTVLSRPAPELDPAVDTKEESKSVPVRDLTEEETVPIPDKRIVITEKAPVIPGRKPQAPAVDIKITAKAEAPKAELVVDKLEEPVVPPRRPDNVQKAPPELVAELRAREAARIESEVAQAVETTKPKPAIDLANPPPPPGPRGKKNMPAVAKPPVESEPLAEQTVRLPTESDPLLDRLVEKDKQSLVATIESMVAAREDGKPLPSAPKEKREQGTSIVKAEPMQRPYNVYRPAKTEEEAEVAAVEAEEPAVPRAPEPRSEDEEAYVSVPFSQGLTEIDAQITSEIESRLLPVLNDNPGWKLQIQAFASPVKDGASSARKASLARAMSVRTFLLGKGIEANRMDIRALGAESDREPMDRVDLIVLDPAKKS